MNLEEIDNLNNNPTYEKISALKELISVIVDYYCFKNDKINESEQDDDDDKIWQKHIENSDDKPKTIIPEEIDYLIEESFKSQLKKFNS